MKMALMSNNPLQNKIIIVLGVIYLGVLCFINTTETATLICVFYGLSIVWYIFISSIEYNSNNMRITKKVMK